MVASEKEIAEFYRYALECRLADTAEVIAWADSKIERVAQPTIWIIELSIAGPLQIFERLADFPGEFRPEIPLFMLFARARRRWLDKVIDDSVIRRIAWKFHCDSRLSKPQQYRAGIIEYFNDEIEWHLGNDQARADEAMKVREFVAEFLNEFQPYEALIPE